MERYQEILNRATKAHAEGKWSEALFLYDKCLVYRPNDTFLLFAMGTALAQGQQYGMSIHLLRQVTERKPDLPDGWHNLAIAYRAMGMREEAVSCYEKELALPGHKSEQMATIYGNLSGAFINEGEPQKAIELADKGLAYDDAWPQLNNHKGLALLELGRYEEGFRFYEARYRLPEFTRRDYGPAPKWDGKRVRRLAIHGEQGIGDELLFLTCLSKVVPLADEIAVECTPRLTGLLRHSFRHEPKVKFFPDHDMLMQEFTPDAWIGMGSLPLLTWPWTPHTYLEPSRAYFRGDKPRLGISWRGGTLRTHEYHRNAPFEFWKPIVETAKALGVDIISLQYGKDAQEHATKFGIPHDEANIEDLDTLAAMIKSCDHVLTVCNTTVHMAGALGVPCTVIVPNKPAWRYGLQGNRSDWYESVDYLRQLPGEGWDVVIGKAANFIREWSNRASHQRGVSSAKRA